ncbi:Retrovirus-related Pol polyprotein like [Argiope bruennichi]|uniref:RNA-directed DNA polymerase n=1 Tax=Argiope bruennichi TaxID=94029 RepID=A0A8T0EV14_ARGBR|nr:Retrovirus-related Pol polyprotein like [Argiope bruennichi]
MNKAIYPKRNQYKSTRFEQRDDRQGLPWIPSQSRRNPGVPSQSRRDPSYKDRPPLSCYGCGEPGVVEAKCAKCNPMVQGDRTQPPTLNHMNFYSISMESQPSSIIEITICGSQAAVCADTGTTHSVAGEKLYHFLKNNGRRFENSTVDMALADGHVQKTDIVTTTKGLWYFSEAPHQSFNFIEPPADIKSLLVVPVASHPCQLRENEGTHLSGEQRTKFNSLLERYEKCFQPGGEPTPFIEHRINTGDHLPVAVPPYRMSPTKKETPYEVCNIAIADLPVRSAKDMYEAQLADENLKKIIDSFESTQKTEDYANWSERGFLMNQGVLYRYLPDADSEEAQLVIPSSERDSIMEKHHDDPMAGHYGEEGTFQRIAKRYYWTGMRKYINDYVKNCPECNRYKANNQKPAGLLRTPVYSQRFEIISIDLFGPLPKTENGKQWIFIIEDCATRWVELFPLSQATASECAITLIEEIFLRYGIPRRIISDNGSQFVSAVLQQVCCTLNISQNLIPVYFPQSNPVERKNRDLKPRLAILVGDDHGNWHSKLPMIRFAMNTAVCDTTGHTPAFLQFGRELRTVDDVVRDFKAVVENDNFVPEITPYLKRFANIMNELRERIEMKQDRRKIYYDKNRKQVFYSPGEKVWVTSHPISNKFKRKTSKFAPRRDGPYIILTQRSPTTYEIASPSDPSTSLGTYHTSALRSYSRNMEADTPLHPIRKRGRPPKLNSLSSGTNRLPDNSNSVSLPGRRRSRRGRM